MASTDQRSLWTQVDINQLASTVASVQATVLGGSISASGDPALPVGGSTVVQLADRSEPTFPTVEELFVHRGFDGTISGAGAAVFKKVFTAPFPLWVRDIWAANDGSDLSGLSGSVFWSLRPRRYRIVTAAGGIASSTEFVDILDSTGTNFSLISNKAQGETFRFYGVTYDASNSKFRTGDSLWMRIAPSGGPANLSDISFTVRWEPV